ncbi:hypothetical protein GCM10017044_00560 [Kordiimonas sediminis]|uniref:Putative auto-transporter adhesin head GIN domain-containing protein n=1 Tax=Kordiimonas sediminis TaxID=1735581 RepID=A0A919AID7_9PROT|nr:head GIN domain-containing protein [Kordiimonas sediminis]GHF10765.1 hypothetical protein GCM10017044_00560 [Kordiimonas sediminis]
MIYTTRVPSSWKAAAIVGVLGVVGLSTGSVSGLSAPQDDQYVTQKRDLDTFDGILVKGAIEVIVTAGEDQSVEVRTRADRQENVKTYLDGSTLVIDMDNPSRKWSDFWNETDVDVTISMETLKKLDISGAVDGRIKNLKTDTFELDLRGAADLDIEGTCDSAIYDVKGAGDIDARDFECAEVDVHVKGAGSASVYARDAVDATVSGVGSISVYGNPDKVNKSVGGIGSISIK